jgi:hypothetical protein
MKNKKMPVTRKIPVRLMWHKNKSDEKI